LNSGVYRTVRSAINTSIPYVEVSTKAGQLQGTMVPTVGADAKLSANARGLSADLEELRERHFDATIQFDQLLEQCCAHGQAGRQSEVRRILAAAEQRLEQLTHIERAIRHCQEQLSGNRLYRRRPAYLHERGRYTARRTLAPASHRRVSTSSMALAQSSTEPSSRGFRRGARVVGDRPPAAQREP